MLEAGRNPDLAEESLDAEHRAQRAVEHLERHLLPRTSTPRICSREVREARCQSAARGMTDVESPPAVVRAQFRA